jgi:hypothetical protein
MDKTLAPKTYSCKDSASTWMDGWIDGWMDEWCVNQKLFVSVDMLLTIHMHLPTYLPT